MYLKLNVVFSMNEVDSNILVHEAERPTGWWPIWPLQVSICLMTTYWGNISAVFAQSGYISSASVTKAALALNISSVSFSLTLAYDSEASAMMKLRKTIQVIQTMMNQITQNKMFSSWVKELAASKSKSPRLIRRTDIKLPKNTGPKEASGSLEYSSLGSPGLENCTSSQCACS